MSTKKTFNFSFQYSNQTELDSLGKKKLNDGLCSSEETRLEFLLNERNIQFQASFN